jgi:hypothetical protein
MYARNAKIHSEKQIAQIRASFREFGVIAPCLVDENYNLIAGHGRLEAARAENLREINCVVVEGLSESQIKAYRLVDNKISEFSEWDMELLPLELADIGADLSDFGFDASVLEDAFDTGFSLEDGDKKPFQQISLTLHDKQAELLLSAIAHVHDNKEVLETFGNENKNGNGIYEVVRQWAEQRKLC